MDITHYFDGRLQLQENGLVWKDVLSRQAEIYDIFLTDFYVLHAISLFGVDANFLVFLQIQIPKRVNDPVCY